MKDGAAAFLTYLLSPDCTIDEMRGMRNIPSLKSTMKAWEEIEGKMYYYFYKNDINRWSADTNPIDETEMGEPGVCVKVDRELFDSFYEYLDGAHVFGNMPQSITDIVVEEIGRVPVLREERLGDRGYHLEPCFAVSFREKLKFSLDISS